MNRLFIFFIFSFLAVSVYGETDRIKVFPVFFFSSDVYRSDSELSNSAELLRKHLVIAQEHYRSLLKTDTFSYDENILNIYRSDKSSSFYIRTDDEWKVIRDNNQPDSAHLMVKELFDHYNEDRYTCKKIYLIIYVRAEGQNWNDWKDTFKFGGARTFNGQPGSGGGVIIIEYFSLTSDIYFPFQSTLTHELGHAFGLCHVDVYGYDMSTTDSIMSYNSKRNSKGLDQCPSPGNLMPEEFYCLAFNKKAFPKFFYEESKHNPAGKKLNILHLGPMSDYIGKIVDRSGEGYELFHNGRCVNSSSASFFTYDQAKDNRDWNIKNNPHIKVECRYNGLTFYPESADPYKYGDIVMAYWEYDGYWYPAMVSGKKDGLYFIRFMDGDIAWLNESKITNDSIAQGKTVQANWKGQGKYYKGTVKWRNGLTVFIKYDDGDEEETTIGYLRMAL